MGLFKRYLIISVAFLILGCDSGNGNPQENSDGTDNSVLTGYDYAITVVSGGESVYVYYSSQNFTPSKEELFFRLDEGECLHVRGEQFANLSIFASRGNIFGGGELSVPAKSVLVQEDYTPLCTNLLRCDPDNYTISSRDRGFIGTFTDVEQYVIQPVEIDAFSNCEYSRNIDSWMEFKVRQYVVGVGKKSLDDSVKAQIAEWGISL